MIIFSKISLQIAQTYLAMERIQMQISQYKKELKTPRVKVSESATEIVRFCTTEQDPLRDGLPKSQNPFVKQSGSICSII